MADRDQHTEIEQLIIKVLTKEATPDEVSFVDDWKEQSEANREMYFEFQRIWEQAKEVEITTEMMEEDWDRIDSEIGVGTGFPLTRIAAVVAMLVAALAVFYIISPFDENVTIATADEIREVELPDGSTVTLNANSSIEYPEEFESDGRTVKFKGEGFFDIEKGTPFTIESQSVEVSVLGTSFNVLDYPDGEKVVVAVSTGKVEMKNEDAALILEAGTSGILEPGGNLEKVSNDPNVLSWKTGIILFTDNTLEKVVEDLEKYYNTDILLENPETRGCLLTAKFEQQSLEQVMEVLQATLELNVKYVDDQVILSGEGCN